jgi:hypothetical protein
MTYPKRMWTKADTNTIMDDAEEMGLMSMWVFNMLTALDEIGCDELSG